MAASDELDGQEQEPQRAHLPPVPLVGKRLTEDIANDLLRGVPVHRVLEGFGKHFAKSTGSDETYELSRPVHVIQDFLSHDWASPRWKKFVTICFLYNSLPAFVASNIVAAATAALQLRGIYLLPSFEYSQTLFGRTVERNFGYGPMATGLISFTAVFLAWQSLWRVLPLIPRFAFLDKVCIHQTEAARKEAGILGLAGILRHSERMVVLWSPKYFSRLWCVYETASWIHLGQAKARGRRTLVMPMDMVVGTLLYMLLIFLYRVVPYVEAMIVIPLTVVLVGIGPGIAMTLMTRSVMGLQRQIAGFSAATAECFCCCAQHVDPATGAAIPCDRVLIYQALEEWFRRDVGESQVPMQWLHHFNEQVSSIWGAQVIEWLRSPRLMYRTGFIVSAPISWELFCNLNTMASMSWGEGLCYALYFATYNFVICPILLKLSFGIACRVQQLSPSWTGNLADCVRALVTSISILVMAMVIAGPYNVVYGRCPLGLAHALTNGVLLVVFMCVYRGIVRRMRAAQVSVQRHARRIATGLASRPLGLASRSVGVTSRPVADCVATVEVSNCSGVATV